MTKKIIVFFMAALLIFQLAACGNTGQKTQNAEKQSPPSDAEGMDDTDGIMDYRERFRQSRN